MNPSMPNIDIYTTQWCPYCRMAKALLTRKGVAFNEIDASSSSVRQAMIQRANGGSTVPQIFIGKVHVGGSDDLHALDYEGRLDPLLASEGTTGKSQ
jgi:glutaredoxin 3